ncbi:uncharacterized protein prr33 [Gambusia affinis]|uniref:uncharacterized protein prr33 n=1 Tax=Gambusia affinis TaxID=33528 RepID=UPI000F3A71D6|nr:uncharacterized protein prr33 [Gambusia affinis]
MSVAYDTIHQLGLFSQQYPPPLLPKPGKDNVRLQKLLKRTAKKKASTQTSQSATPFRSSLSPVNEASPDLERSDHSTSPQTPETTPRRNSIQQPPRFTVRPLYQHVPSPYPQRAAFDRAVSMSPPMVAAPSCTYSHHVTKTLLSSASNQFSKVLVSPGEAKQSLPYSSVPEVSIQTTELETFTESQAGLRPAPHVGIPHSKITSSGATQHLVSAGQPVVRPLTVLTPLIKCKSPRPTFKATEPSKSPKPMFEVPQIRMYTASTSYYETSRTPPVYDTAGLTAIGHIVPQSKTLAETKQEVLTASEIRGGKATTTTMRHPLLDVDPGRKTPTSEVKGATPKAEVRRVTPTLETQRVTSVSEIKQATPTPNIETTRPTQTAEHKTTTPTYEVRVQTPTYEFLSSRRPKTPAYHISRAATPVFEISRPNPLLFAVSPITVDPERLRSPQTISSVSTSLPSLNLKTTELSETLLNGDVHSDVTPADNSIKRSITMSKSESDLTRRVTGSQRAVTPISVSSTQVATAYQRPKTPTYEASRLLTTSPGYKKQKTLPSSILHVVSQRPKTPDSQKSKSAYRGLTPAEYAAYSGIKTYSPAFSITTSVTPTQDEVKVEKEVSKQSSHEAIVKKESSVEIPERQDTTRCEEKLDQSHVKTGSSVTVPVIVVSTPSDSTGTISIQDPCTATSPGTAKQAATATQEMPKAMAVPSENQKEKTKVTTKTKIKDSFLKSGDQDSLKVVKKLLSRGKVQTDEEKAKCDVKADKSVIIEPKTPVTQIKHESSKSESAEPTPPIEAPSTKSTESHKSNAKPCSADKPDKKGVNDSSTAAASLLNVMQKSKGMKSKASGWSRLKKHMVVEQEEPKFPVTGFQAEIPGQDQSEEMRLEENPSGQDEKLATPKDTDTPKATKMWDAVLFQMFSSKENIMHQIELNKSEDEKNEKSNEQTEVPSFAFRLPVLLFSPRFDAKKLREAASRPVSKISVVFEMGLIGRKGKEDEPKDFNRKARGFAAS